jgi:hypothetical protein
MVQHNVSPKFSWMRRIKTGHNSRNIRYKVVIVPVIKIRSDTVLCETFIQILCVGIEANLGFLFQH